jgi:hypothetical protein
VSYVVLGLDDLRNELDEETLGTLVLVSNNEEF